MMTMTMVMKKTAMQRRALCLCLPVLVLACTVAGFGEDKPARVAGKWQFSWEARIATESGTLQLEQADSKLSGSYHGNLTAPKVSGAIEGNKITLNMNFQRAHPFTIVFTGTIDGDKMSGKFVIPGMENGYDPHGENVRPSNYSWAAVRLPDHAPSGASGQ
jgi:hypothetical protein